MWRWPHRNHASTITSLIAAKQTVATFHNKRSKKEDALAIFYGKIHFIYPADKTFPIIRIIDFSSAEPACYRTNFHCAISGEQNGAFSYIVLRIMLLTYSPAMIQFSNCGGVCRMQLEYACSITLLHLDWPKLHRVLTSLSGKRLTWPPMANQSFLSIFKHLQNHWINQGSTTQVSLIRHLPFSLSVMTVVICCLFCSCS